MHPCALGKFLLREARLQAHATQRETELAGQIRVSTVVWHRDTVIGYRKDVDRKEVVFRP